MLTTVKYRLLEYEIVYSLDDAPDTAAVKKYLPGKYSALSEDESVTDCVAVDWFKVKEFGTRALEELFNEIRSRTCLLGGLLTVMVKRL